MARRRNCELTLQTGRVPNSAARSNTLGAGMAFIGSGGNLGVSVQRYDTRYGVPLRPGASGEHGPRCVASTSRRPASTCAARSSWAAACSKACNCAAPMATIAMSSWKAMSAGTRFAGNGVEFAARSGPGQSRGWRGRSGVQYFTRKLTIAGAEAVVPDNTIDRFGMFTLQSLKTGQLRARGGWAL